MRTTSWQCWPWPLSGYYQWLPALIFQVALALWLLIKGVATPARGQPA